MNRLELVPIGTIHTPFTDLAGMPIQPAAAAGSEGRVELFPDYAGGVKDLDGFSHVILLYYFHLSRGYELQVVPFLDQEPRGLFATRAPRRPNPIGLSIVTLKRVVGRDLFVADVDILDGTPLLDLKPFVPEFDNRPGARSGWLRRARRELHQMRADSRFVDN